MESNAEKDIISIVVFGWKNTDKYICKSCGAGKFKADNAVCPKCGQKHTISVKM